MQIAFVESALLVVDAQCGFTELCPEELPVPGGLALVAPINRLLALPWKRIDASQDWHSPDHHSFRGQRDNLYPPHCVAGTRGAEFLPGLNTMRFHAIWRKGYDRDFEAYAVTAQHPGFADVYRAAGISTVAICGLAANICCFFAARDLRGQGFRVLLVEDASAGIDVPDAGLLQASTKEEAQRMGIDYVTVQEIERAAAGSAQGRHSASAAADSPRMP
ncbi:MAG: isochorismatase family protein [Planctomycetes bacterium]|nr:isochorismatase family protein [Planctomycetota bacterium]